jgi:membrane protein
LRIYFCDGHTSRQQGIAMNRRDVRTQNPEAAQPHRATTLVERKRVSLWGLRSIALRQFGQRLWVSLNKEDLTGRAAQLAYYFFFALFPALIAASALMGLLIKSAGELNDQLLSYLANVIPPSAYQIVADTFKQTAHASSGGKVLVGTLVALWSASTGTSAVQDALNAIHSVEEKRPFWRARLTAILLTIAVGSLFILALGALFLGDKLVAHEHAGYGYLAVFAVRLITWPVAFALAALGFALVYWKAPNLKDQPWEWITPGAAIGIVVWLLASLALRVYLHYFNSYSVTYGSLGAVIVLLTWFYLSGLALLLGSVINGTLEAMYGEMGSATKPGGEPQA